MIKLLSKTAILGMLSFVFISGKEGETNLPFQNTQKLYLCMSDLGTSGAAFVAANNIPYVMLVTSSSIDPADDMSIREDLLKARITQLFPNPTDRGFAILDWEGKAMNALSSPSTDDSEFQTILNKFISVLQFSKQLRPNVKWGIYGMPFREYWNRNASWEQRNLKLIPLLKMCDIITPSLYNPYPDAVSKGNEKLYVHGNMQLALKIGNMVNRPVLPLIWHRLPNNDLIPKDEFLRHVKAILDESYNGTRASGLIWWGADLYFYNIKAKPLLTEVGSKENFIPYHDKLIINYGSGILNLFGR